MAPAVTVVVPSHERPARLRRLLDALDAQALDPDSFDVVVVHDSPGEETDRLLAEHPIARRGALHRRRLPAGTGTPARQRNVGWRLAGAPLVAFTDDDCRPEPGWLAALLESARREPGAVVQGATVPDPLERDLMDATHHRTLRVDPPGPFGQTCNILYPRDLLERLRGFDERYTRAGGEDTDLFWRAREAGATVVGEPTAVVNHAVEAFTTLDMVRLCAKWGDLPHVVDRHPGVRAEYTLGILWRDRHAWLILAAAGALTARRWPPAALLAAPYARWALGTRGRGMRARLRAARELPPRAVVDAAEIAVLAEGSVRHRVLFI
jgi:GT2 family glycosyltransferase